MPFNQACLGSLSGAVAQTAFAKFLCYEAANKADGLLLDVVRHSDSASTILIPNDFIDASGRSLNTCNGKSLNKSLLLTLKKELSEGEFASQIGADEKSCPKWFLNGAVEPMELHGDSEVWLSHAAEPAWASVYSWCEKTNLLSQRISLSADVEPLGYVTIVEATNKEFCDPARFHPTYGKDGPAWITEAMQQKIWARYGYKATALIPGFSDAVRRNEEPDAYIVQPEVVKLAGMRVAHTYTILKPKAAA